ncbi:MAG: CHAT domain-containing protein, partial [Bacteroidota bacterium]
MADQTFIYSVFANDFSGSLHSLKEEKRGLRTYLRDKAGIEHVVFEDAVSSLLVDELTSYSEKIHIFHFAGHANGQTLKLEKADGEAEDFDVAQLKGYLQKSFCENIKLAFLNACNTHKLGQELIKAGIPAAIITYGVVPDSLAKDISLKFFEILSKDKNKELSLKKMLDALNIYISATLKEESYTGSFRSGDDAFFEFDEELKERTESEYLW